MKNKQDPNQITLIDHTAMDEENWQEYSINIDASAISSITLPDEIDYDFSNIYVNSGDNNMSGKLSLSGEDADIEINGKSLARAIENIERRLEILHVNPELENEFQELHQLGEQYRKLEKKLLEKQEVWKRLNKSD